MTQLLDTIGNTPLVELVRMRPNPDVRILAKLEYMNPGGSIKDRAAFEMIRLAEASGVLTPDKTVIEATSGNTGIGLAMVCAVKGYKLVLAMSESASLERRRILKARGAEIILTPGHLGTDGAIEEVYRLAREYPDRYFVPDQYNNPANWSAHIEGTARELWEQSGESVDLLVATMGTTGTLMGLSRGLKALSPDVEVLGVEPFLGHRIQGLKNMKEAYQPEIYEKGRLDRKVNIEDEAAFDAARRLAREEGLFVGMSSGAAMAVAMKEAEKMESGTIVAIFPDSGERYLSTELFADADPLPIRFHNTLFREKRDFRPIQDGKVSIYSCGPTVDERKPVSLLRRYVFSDLLCRYLESRGLAVDHVMNVTDMDDRTIAGAEGAGLGLSEYTRIWEELFFRDLERLRITPPRCAPRVSEHLPEMVGLVETLVEREAAYEKHHSIYFDIAGLPEYGALSGVDLEKIRVGATVDLEDYEKDNPRDFTLLKRSRLSELKKGICVATKWGNVRPSLHLQCAAISMKYLGQTFDIHTSSRELVFPHHENERAIAMAATGRPLSNCWMHCDLVRLEKGAFGFAEMPDLDGLSEEGFSDREIRFWLVTTPYRKPAMLTGERMRAVKRSLARIDSCIRRLQGVPEREGRAMEAVEALSMALVEDFQRAMDDDLNISAAMGGVFHQIRRINRLLDEKRMSKEGATLLLNAFARLDSVLGILDLTEPVVSADVTRLMDERETARQKRDWAEADRIRALLEDRGVQIRDEKMLEV